MALAVTKSQVRQIGELAQTFRWSLQIIRPPKNVIIAPNLNIQCTSTEVPKDEDNELIEVNIRGFKIKRPGTQDESHSINLNLLETTDSQISIMLETWRSQVWDRETGQQRPIADCGGDIMLVRLDNLNKAIWQYTLLGCYPQGSDPTGGELGGESEALKPTLNLYYDTFKSSAV